MNEGGQKFCDGRKETAMNVSCHGPFLYKISLGHSFMIIDLIHKFFMLELLLQVSRDTTSLHLHKFQLSWQ